jgi:hypothetical protein
MAINQLQQPQVAKITSYLPELTDSDIEKMVQSAIGSLKCNARAFEHAKQTYNSDFFKGESAEFKRALCKALDTFFSPVGTHQFWKKAGA